MSSTLYNELLALTRLAEVARIADATPDYRRGLEVPIEQDMLAALNASPTLAAALGFQPAARWMHGPKFHADVIGDDPDQPTNAEVKIWSQENSNGYGFQFDVMQDRAPANADLVVITRTRRMPTLIAGLGADTPWRVITLAGIADTCEELLLSLHLSGVMAATHPDMLQAIREQALGSARLVA